VSRARKVVAFIRLLARLRQAAPDGWMLKRGFALELHLAGRSRTTRDVDLDFAAGLEVATEALVAAATTDLGDYFEFAVERVGAADVGPPGGGVRFRAEARVARRPFETLAIDVGVGPTTPFAAAFKADSLRAAVDVLFGERATHAVPAALPAIPTGWARPYAAMAAEVGLAPVLRANDRSQRWDAESRAWQ